MKSVEQNEGEKMIAPFLVDLTPQALPLQPREKREKV
jgi:hypothetical protein